MVSGKDWEKLMSGKQDDTLHIDIFIRNDAKKWASYPTIANPISGDEIEEYIVYRQLPPTNILWNEMGIFQYSLHSLKSTPIMTNKVSNNNCMNCHTFSAYSPDRFMFHMRAQYGGTLIKYGKEIRFIDTKIEEIGSAGAYPSWHPSGRFIAYSVNSISQSFHSQRGMVAYVHDQYSDIVLYDLEENTITRPAALASGALENLPSWSPDGKKLFFISAPAITDSLYFRDLKYNLLSIEFDETTKKFGKIDTVLNANKLNKSVSFPRVAADNQTLAFCLLDYGYFSIYNKESDIYTCNIKSGEPVKISGSSEDVESYPSWSKNGRWLMFVSKKEDAYLSKVYFCHVNEQGETGKPFLAPQKNPDFYKNYLLNYNRPEFASARMKLNPGEIIRVARKGAEKAIFDEENSVSISSGATSPANENPEEMYSQDR